MRIPGAALRTPITIAPFLGNLGDGDTWGDPVPFKAAVKTRVEVTQDSTGQTITTWSRCRVRPDTVVTGAAGVRGPVPGDRVTVNGVTRRIATAEPVQGPGTAVAFLELVAGDG